ncbi:hypothetical protein B0H21DRAFT_710585 [Amylocystis lapponica]|nr:hypothetical protein B0H21DRAFT_710585 [Amylocystis lapponica]
MPSVEHSSALSKHHLTHLKALNMVQSLQEAPVVRHEIPVYMPKPTLPPSSYREIFEGDWNIEITWRNQHDTKQGESDEPVIPERFRIKLATHSFIQAREMFVFDPFRVDSPGEGDAFTGRKQCPELSIFLGDDSQPEWPPALGLIEEPDASLGLLSPLDSLDTLPSLPQSEVVKVDTFEYDDVNLENPTNVAEILGWSNKILEWDPTTRVMPPLPRALAWLLRDILPAKEEKSLVSALDAVTLEEDNQSRGVALEDGHVRSSLSSLHLGALSVADGRYMSACGRSIERLQRTERKRRSSLLISTDFPATESASNAFSQARSRSYNPCLPWGLHVDASLCVELGQGAQPRRERSKKRAAAVPAGGRGPEAIEVATSSSCGMISAYTLISGVAHMYSGQHSSCVSHAIKKRHQIEDIEVLVSLLPAL